MTFEEWQQALKKLPPGLLEKFTLPFRGLEADREREKASRIARKQ